MGATGLFESGVAHARPRIGAVRHADTELERAEPGACLFAALEIVFDLLIDRDTAGPAGGVSDPPWMFPGNSSMPVRRQLMPRM